MNAAPMPPIDDLPLHVIGKRDRVMDVLDSRHVPTPHPPGAGVKSGRWGDYVLGHSTTDSTDGK